MAAIQWGPTVTQKVSWDATSSVPHVEQIEMYWDATKFGTHVEK